MEITHNLGIFSTSRNADENAGFLLANKKGSYCSFFNSQNSRYYGLFYFDAKAMQMYKLLESIDVIGHPDITSLKNGFYFAERKRNGISESFIMPEGYSSLIYELSRENEIDIYIDCKKPYDNREWGRYYEISEDDGIIIVKFTKKTDRREDETGNKEEFSLYLAVKSDNFSFVKNGLWVERHYSEDEERKSQPFRRYVYNAMRLKGARFVFSMSKSKSDAKKECENVFSSMEQIKNREKENFFAAFKNESIKKILKNESISRETKVAYVCAFNSLSKMALSSKPGCGIFAGLPWFFQFWSRDSLISIKSASKINKEFADSIINLYLGSIGSDGRLPNLIGQHSSISLGSADAHGWLFLRCREMIEMISRRKQDMGMIKKSMNAINAGKHSDVPRIREYLKRCSIILRKKESEHHEIQYGIEAALEKSLYGLMKYHTRGGFETNQSKETWMDTDFGGDGRKGVRIEVQALRLGMYRLMHELTCHHKYKALENILKIKTLENFWNGKILADGLDDFTIRPNIFIAAYAYPELLSSKEWETCFENALSSLWLEWGGLSTIDKSNPLFTNENSGEDIRSYHRGDSWFWINNLSALVLNRISDKKFKNQIKKIIDASTEEILWKGCIGCHSELSSAKRLESKGCFSQAWSNAMYIELIDEVFR